MSIPNIENKIKKAISDHLDQVQLDFLSPEAEETVKLAIDADDLAEEVMKALNEHVFSFDSSPYADQHCHTCQKMFGDFVSKIGARVQADELLRPNVTILLD